MAQSVAPWLADQRARSSLVIASVEGAGVRVLDAEQQVVARSTGRGMGGMGRRRGQGPGPGLGEMAQMGIDRVWQTHWSQVLSGGIVRDTTTLSSGEQVFVAAIPARYQGKTVGAVVIHARLADLKGAAAAMFPVIAITSVAAALIAMLVGAWLSRRMTRPLQRMTQAAERVAAGDLEVKVNPPAWQEGESLALAFNRMTQDLAAQETARRQFIADASHQLRAPLTSLQAHAEALLDEMVSDEANRRRYLGRIVQETRGLAALAQQLLDLERLEARQAAPHPQSVDVAVLAREVADAFSVDNGPRVTAEVADGLPPALADPDKARQALGNLVDNALKHTPADRRVRVWARVEGEMVRLGVTDEGAGIAPEHLPHIWDRFYRVPGDPTEGSGLGLAIVKQIVQRQHGQVAVESKPGQGSTFSFTLPQAGTKI